MSTNRAPEDYTKRIPVLEPFLLILKSRKGIAFIVSLVLLSLPLWAGISEQMAFEFAVAAWVYIGGQSYVDGKTAATKTQEEIKKVVDTAIDKKLGG